MENNTTQQENIIAQSPVADQDLHTNQPAETQVKTTVGFWEFVELIALFAIPVVGFIAGIIFLFASKRKTLKNYAGAMLTWMGIRLLTSILTISILLSVIGGFVLPTLNQQLGTEFTNVNEIIGIADGLITKNYSKIIKSFGPQLINTFGEEYAPLVEELSKEEYNDLIQQVIEKDYDTLLTDIQNDKYPNLKTALGTEEFNSLISELKAVKNGESSEFFDTINETLSSFM